MEAITQANPAATALGPIHIDPRNVGRLRLHDSYMSCRIRRRIQDEKDSFFLYRHRLQTDSPCALGIREIWLTRTTPGTACNYCDLDRRQVNQFHGSASMDRLTVSIRIEGHFTDEFARSIPRPDTNPDSTPSFLAYLLEGGVA